MQISQEPFHCRIYPPNGTLMLFLPYKMDSQKRGFPLITPIICMICFLVYAQQYQRDNRHYEAAEYFCAQQVNIDTQTILDRIGHSSYSTPCYPIFKSIRNAEDSSTAISEMVDSIQPLTYFDDENDNRNYMTNELEKSFRRYKLFVPRELTKDLSYNPSELDLLRMTTANFSHADVFHLFGNLLFFFVFGASVELIVGYFAYAAFIGVATIATSLGYSYAMMGVENAMPTIGLSGVVMVTLAALGVMMPKVKIRCFFWFIWIFRVFRVPVSLLALWYVAWDIIDMNRIGDVSYINYAAHISGAATGAAFGAIYLLFGKATISEAAIQYG